MGKKYILWTNVTDWSVFSITNLSLPNIMYLDNTQSGPNLNLDSHLIYTGTLNSQHISFPTNKNSYFYVPVTWLYQVTTVIFLDPKWYHLFTQSSPSVLGESPWMSHALKQSHDTCHPPLLLHQTQQWFPSSLDPIDYNASESRGGIILVNTEHQCLQSIIQEYLT